MKILAPLRAIGVFAAAFGCACSVSAQGVIANDAAILPIFGSGQYLTLTNSIDPSQGRYGLFAIEISGSGSQFTFSYGGIAEEYALFAATPGIVIDPAFAATTTPLVSNNGVDPGSTVQTFTLGQSRYFGYWDDRHPNIGDRMPEISDNYGWVQITRTVSGLQVSSSATALGGGIVAGTFTQVPEPSASVLVLLGVGLYLCARRFGFRSPTPPNHALQRTRHSVVVCNRCVPRAGSLSLGR